MSEVGLPTRLVAIAVGAASALAVEKLTSKVLPQHRANMGSTGLVIAAAIYPAARRGKWVGLATGRELAGVAVATAIAVAQQSKYQGPPAQGGEARLEKASWQTDDKVHRAVVAAGWVAHAAFDHFHHAGSGGRLPRWYPALCAGYDIAFAAMLMRPNPQRSDEFVVSVTEK